MKAIVLSDVTKIDDIELKEVEIPKVVPGWVLIKVKAFGMNHSEVILRNEEIIYNYIKKHRHTKPQPLPIPFTLLCFIVLLTTCHTVTILEQR